MGDGFWDGLGVALLEIEALHVHVHAAVYRGVGAGQDAGDNEGVVHEPVVRAVGGGKCVAHREAEGGGDRAPQHAAEELAGLEIAADSERERAAVTEGEPVEVGGGCAHDPVAAVIVSHADRHGVCDAAGIPAGDAIGAVLGRQEILIDVPADVLDRLADEVDAVQDQLQRAPLRPHDEVVAQPLPG